MAEIKSLVKETALYGVSSILGRVLSWLMTPLFTYTLGSTSDFGIITNLYAYAALVQVILTFGMETGLFRFANQKDKYKPDTVYATTLLFVGFLVLLFVILTNLFIKPITHGMGGDNIPYLYVQIMVLVMSMDSFSAIPFAYLRYKQRPVKFVALKMFNIILYVILCCFFLIVCPMIDRFHPKMIAWFYDPDFKVGYILISNLIATCLQTLLLLTDLRYLKFRFDGKLLNKMIVYCYPLLILGIAGILNQTIDKIIFPKVYPDHSTAMSELGVYGACFKIAIIMVMFTQAFRYAYEPFVFSKTKERNNKEIYSRVMKYFILFGILIFLTVCFYMDIIKFFVAPKYYPGLKVVPNIMIATLFFGIYFNLSMWYKLTDQTYWGAILSVIGCIIIVAVNILFIPKYSYWACVWASFCGYTAMMVLSYVLGQKYYPIKYDIKSALIYSALAAILYFAFKYAPLPHIWERLLWGTFLLLLFIIFTIKRDIPLEDIPFLGKFKKIDKNKLSN